VVASGSDDCLVKLWDIPARRWLKDFSSHREHVRSVSCSADGSKLASASHDETVKVYDVATGATLKTIPMDSGFVSLSPKGDRLVCGEDDLEIWDLPRDERVTIPMAHGNDLILSACFSPDATLIASAGDNNSVKLWTTEFHTRPDSHSRTVTCMCFSEDGSLIASGSSDGTVKIWDPTNCSCLFTLSTDTLITSVAFSPNHTLVAAGSYDGTVWIWDVESQKLRTTIRTSSPNSVELIRFSPDESKLVSASNDKSIRVWDAETGSLLAFNYTNRSIEWMTFSDGDEIVVQGDGKLEKLKLCAVSSTSSPTIDPSEELEMEGTSTPFDLVWSTDDELTIQPPSTSYRLFRDRSDEWDDQWIMDSQGRRVFHWPDGYVSACHMRKLAVGTTTGRVAIVDFSNITY
jgi:WD40 repeat protein